MTIASWWLHRQCGYHTPVLFLLRLSVPTAASVAVVLPLAGHHVIVVLAAAAVAYLAINAAIGPLTWSTMASLRPNAQPEQLTP
ncbi:putative membrane protein [Mycobacterium ulcerans str. Harvey]|nr:putative membrane protein [Mycobacterium ulcerans str. Harvey]